MRAIRSLVVGLMLFTAWNPWALGLDHEGQSDDLAEWKRLVADLRGQITEAQRAIRENERSELGKIMRPRLYQILGDNLVDLCYLYSIANLTIERRAAAEEAKATFQTAMTKGTPRASAHAGLGRAASCAEDYLSAIEHYKQALQADPGIPDVHRNLGIAYVKLARFRNAREVLESAIRNNPDDDTARFHLASVYLELGLPHLAKEQCESLKELGRGALCAMLKFEKETPHEK